MKHRASSVIAAWLCVAAGVVPASAQQRTITGHVTSSLDGKPVAGASVTVLASGLIAQTNDRGEFAVVGPQGVG